MRFFTVAVVLSFLSISLFAGCKTTGQDVPVNEKKPDVVKKTEPAPTTGWNDADTYTVRVQGADLEAAKGNARHRILKDIVNVRVLNGSRYTDITKISGEFDKPLKGGKVLRQKNTASGIEIYFQIRDKGLKKKFERK